MIRHEFIEGTSFQALNLYRQDVGPLWVVPVKGDIHLYRRRSFHQVPVMAFDPEHRDGIQERLDALGEMNDGDVDVHLVEIKMPEETLYAFFAVERGAPVELAGWHESQTDEALGRVG